MSLQAEQPVLVRTRTTDSLAWMRLDARMRLLPFGLALVAVWVAARPGWLGLAAGDARAQLIFGVAGAAVMFVGTSLGQLWITRRVRGTVKVPANGDDVVLQTGYYLINAAAEEGFFRGLLQGGLTVLAGPVVGLLVATPAYVLYHRLGGWGWTDVLATALVGVPLGLAFWLLPGPPSLLGVVLVHFGATCGFLGPGPWLLRRFNLL